MMNKHLEEGFTTVLLVALLGAGAFWNGMYSPAQQLIVTGVMALLAVCVRRPAGLSLLELAAMALLSLGSVLSMRSPAAAGAAAHGPVIMAGWFLALLLGRRFAPGNFLPQLLGKIWAVTGFLMVFGGLAAMSYQPVHQSGRLASFLGYPIAVGILGLLGMAGTMVIGRLDRWWACLLLYGNGVALFLSGSRGVWAAAVLLGLYLLWLDPARCRQALGPAAWAFAAALWVGPLVPVRATAPALLAFAAGGLASVLAVRLGQRTRHWSVRALVWSAWGTVLLLAPGWDWFRGRAGTLPLTDGSSIERMAFLRDGLAIARATPLGAGYRAWTALHLQAASYAYYSAEVHSVFLDLTIAFGWVGAAGFLLLLTSFLARLRKGRSWPPERAIVLGALAALAVHALLDWDLSYGLFMVPLWLGFGLAGSDRGREELSFPKAAVAAGLVISVALILGAGDLFTDLADDALAAGQPAVAYRQATLAASVTPWNDLSHAELGRALSALGDSSRALSQFDRARALGPYEPWYANLAAQELLKAGRLSEAAGAYREYVRLWPWMTDAYEEALRAHEDMVIRAQLRPDDALVEELLSSGRSILAALDRQKAKEPAGAPRKPMATETEAIQAARAFFGSQR